MNLPIDPLEDGEQPEQRWLSIPTQFHSVQHEGPFTRCIQCEVDLPTSGRLYAIEKIYRGKEVIIELAMCLDCRDSSSECMSKESIAAIGNYFDSKLDVNGRLNRLSQTELQESSEIMPWIDSCVISGQKIESLHEYQIFAICQGNELQREFFPMMISGSVIEEISEILSEQTKGWMDDFIGDNFGLPSEFCDPPLRPVFL